VDPDNGDYRPAPGSPALGYGCQTFAVRGIDTPPVVTPPGILRVPSGRRDEIIVSGPVTTDTHWKADTVRVIGNVTVEDGVTLTIVPGARVVFEDYYRLEVQGTLIAAGTAEGMITFTTDEPERWKEDRTLTGCWNGIRFHGTAETNAPSRIEHCIIEYSKAVNDSGAPWEYGGGAISAVGFSKLTIAGCIVRHNLAENGGAIYLHRMASPTIFNNLIVDNHALVNAAAVYCSYAYPQLISNTITGNAIHNQEQPYETTSAVLCFLSKPVFTNNIVRDNEPDLPYLHYQLWANKAYHTTFNNITDIDPGGGNIDADPLFRIGPRGSHYLSQLSAGQAADSPCLDSGSAPADQVCPPPAGVSPCLGRGTTRTDEVNDSGQADIGFHHGWKSAAAHLTCLPASGTLPFQTRISAAMGNRFGGFTRTLAARIDIELADGQCYGNWRTGQANLGPAGALQQSWYQAIPALDALAGINRFILTVVDVTPSPYNQPPFPPSGDSDLAVCEVTGRAGNAVPRMP